MERIVRGEPGLLRRPVDMEQEDPVEQIQEFALVTGDATDEYCPILPGQDFGHPRAAPHPAMRTEPLPVRTLRPAHPVAGCIFPVRKLRVIVWIDGQQAATGQLPGKRRLPRSGIASHKKCRHKASSQP